MKNLIYVIALLASISTHAQSFLGDWKGNISVNGMQIPLLVHITEVQKNLTVTLDSPLQKATGIKTTSSINNDSIFIKVPMIGAKYAGKLVNDSIVGNFDQNGQQFPLKLSRIQAGEPTFTEKSQTPKAPFPYSSKEIVFQNTKANVTLAGTLTIPKGKGNFPVVVLVSGSGPQNRDCEILGHSPFLVIADYLSRHGIAVLRYDDRGVGKSTGDFSRATSFDFADDATAALQYVRSQKQFKQAKIGLFGHSEGGMIAEIIAAKNTDLNFAILAAAPGKEISTLMLDQIRAVSLSDTTLQPVELEKSLAASEAIFSILKSQQDDFSKRKAIEKIYPKFYPDSTFDQRALQANINTYLSPWFQTFIQFKPADYLKDIRIPILAFNGNKDVQVDVSNLDEIASILTENNSAPVEIHRLKNLNHLFQTTNTGNVSEYAQLDETFNEDVLQLITAWILKQ